MGELHDRRERPSETVTPALNQGPCRGLIVHSDGANRRPPATICGAASHMHTLCGACSYP